MGDYNGSALIGMIGKECVAIATDTRLSVRLQTIDTNFQKVFKVNDRTLIGLPGLATDVQTAAGELRRKERLYSLEEDSDMSASMFANLVSSFLYKQRFAPYYLGPIVAGLDYDKAKKTWTPVLASYDLIGCMDIENVFAVGGTGTDLLYGACESYYKDNMEPDELFEVISQALLASMDRDSLAGWGAQVYILTPTQLITKKLYARLD